MSEAYTARATCAEAAAVEETVSMSSSSSSTSPRLRFEGTYTAIITPFRDVADDAQKAIDWEAYERVVAAQLAGGVTGIVPCGTTGESPSLDHEEQLAVIERTVKLVKGKSTVLAGTGANSTRATIALSRAAERVGADAVMVVVPY
jgi:4-hydroxy-tetrahydrodipicolinate synthase